MVNKKVWAGNIRDYLLNFQQMNHELMQSYLYPIIKWTTTGNRYDTLNLPSQIALEAYLNPQMYEEEA